MVLLFSDMWLFSKARRQARFQGSTKDFKKKQEKFANPLSVLSNRQIWLLYVEILLAIVSDQSVVCSFFTSSISIGLALLEP